MTKKQLMYVFWTEQHKSNRIDHLTSYYGMKNTNVKYKYKVLKLNNSIRIKYKFFNILLWMTISIKKLNLNIQSNCVWFCEYQLKYFAQDLTNKIDKITAGILKNAIVWDLYLFRKMWLIRNNKFCKILLTSQEGGDPISQWLYDKFPNRCICGWKVNDWPIR